MPLPPHFKEDRVTLEALARRDARALALGEGIVVCRVLGRYLLYADAFDLDIVPHLCFSGHWESWVTIALARELQEGMYCVDAGANHGYFTVLFADAAGPDGRAVAIEPNPRLAGHIRRSLITNGFDRRAVVVEAALWSQSGVEMSLAYPPDRTGGGSVVGARPDDEEVRVQSTTLDDVTADWPRVDFVKIDAEGAETAIWAGMSGVIERNRRLKLVLEFNAIRYSDPSVFLGQIADAGFRLRRIDSRGEIVATSADELVGPRGEEEVMLFLERS